MFPGLGDDDDSDSEGGVIPLPWRNGTSSSRTKTKNVEKVRASVSIQPSLPNSIEKRNLADVDALPDNFLARMAMFMLVHITFQ